MKDLKKFKIIYWSNREVKKIVIESASLVHAKIKLYLLHKCDDIISIEEVKDDV